MQTFECSEGSVKDNPLPARKSLGYWSILSIAIGGMVGGGIFAVLGLAAQLAQGGTPVAFALAGIVALTTSYSYTRLSVTFPCRGGTVEFLNQAFGPGLITGGLNILLWISYLVMLSLYAYAFGSYGASFFPADLQPLWKHILISGAVVLFTGLNIVSSKIVGNAEKWIVGFKISILLLFIAGGLWSVNIRNLQPSNWTNPLQLVAGGMIIFLAYEGFELIANTAEDVKDPEKTLPHAYYSSIGLVIILYILVSIVAVGNLTADQIIASRDYALAVSAHSFLGSFGFILIAIAALLSTGSAINATLYGASRISYIIAKEGELPVMLENKIWNRPVEGLLLTSGLTLIIANLFDLSSISIMGSSGFLLIFAAVNASNARLHSMTNSKRWLSGLGAILCLSALGTLIMQIWMVSPEKIWVLVIMIGMAFIIEAIYRFFSNRVIKSSIRKIEDDIKDIEGVIKTKI